MSDLQIDTGGNCFLCTSKIFRQVPDVKLEAAASLPATSSVHSLQYLSRYLKMDMRRVFDEEEVIPPDLMAKVENARLKVELCEPCTSLNNSVSRLYRHLEKVQMEMVSYVNLIHKRMGEMKGTLADLSFGNTEASVNGKLKIAKVLREEAKQKCLRKLNAAAGPTIKMRNWSKKQLHATIQNIRESSRKTGEEVWKGSESTFNCQTNPENSWAGDVGVKEEYPHSHADPIEDDDNIVSQEDNFNDYYDEQNEESEHSESQTSESAIISNPDKVTNKMDVEIEKPLSDPTSSTSPKYEVEAGSYKCKLCSKAFGSKLSWKLHYEVVHLKVRYKCNLCGIEFGQRSTYNRHHQSVHVGVRFKCLACSKTFTQKGHLTQHQKKGGCNSKIPSSNSKS